MTDFQPQDALDRFLPGITVSALEPLGSGNVNLTWLVRTEHGGQYVLQRLNPAVFPEPRLIQENLSTLLAHLRDRSREDACDFRLFRLLIAPDGSTEFIDPAEGCWRMVSYLENTRTLNTISTPAQALAIGRCLGAFHRLVSTLPVTSMADTLPGFHNTPLYLEQYDRQQTSGSNPAPDGYDFIEQRRKDVALLENERKQSTVREQIVHGDPKVANFLFAGGADRVVSLIDLDTVKPGLLLHDIGDCLRSCCNPKGEEVNDPDTIVFDRELFGSMLTGYYSQAAGLLTGRDKELVVDSVRLLALELGIRFLTDHLAGNRYFKVCWPQQNLFRARVQFALVRSIESQYTEIETIWRGVQQAAFPDG